MRILEISNSMIVLGALSLALVQSHGLAQQPGTPARPQTPAVAGTPGADVPPETVVLTIGTEKVTRAQFEELLSALSEQGRSAATSTARRQVAEQLGELSAIAQEARKRKLDQSPVVKNLITIQVDQVLAGTLAKQLSDVKADDPAAKAFYESHKAQYEQVKASHILIRFKGSQVPVRKDAKDLTEDEALAKAQGIKKQLAAGGDFAALAKAESDDTGSAVSGGSLGTFSHGQMVPPFEQAVFSLPVGQVSDPVKTQFGYHIIKVEERTSKTFDEAKADIGQQIGRDALEKIKKQTPVTLDEKYFGK